MAFRFKPAEPIGQGFHRIAAEQVERALTVLASGEDRGKAVHEARKTLKRLRALLRLVRPAIGETVYQAENARLRDAGRLLSDARDQAVMLETIAAVSAEAASHELAALKALQKITAAAAFSAHGDAAGTAGRAIELIARAGEAIATCDISEPGFGAVGPGLRRSFAKGRTAMARARREPSDEAIHEWRKTVQVHWRHMRLLGEAWPEYTGLRAELARDLSQVLGDDHDLAVLAARAQAAAGHGLSARQAGIIVQLARSRQDALRLQAERLGGLLFADTARDLARRMARYWRIAERRSLADAATKVGRDTHGAPARGASQGTGEGRRVLPRSDVRSDGSAPARQLAQRVRSEARKSGEATRPVATRKTAVSGKTRSVRPKSGRAGDRL
ncbi:MAG: CHAD domain-containing protein [Hyphomicrobiaceae bacterium]|nr:CHAD domain-containing protein [Hyphomicrobiaceae bacterium]